MLQYRQEFALRGVSAAYELSKLRDHGLSHAVAGTKRMKRAFSTLGRNGRLKACLETRRGWLLAPGEAAAHRVDHGPVDDGLVMFGEAFVVADGTTAAGDLG
jgi:hypothetical protein